MRFYKNIANGYITAVGTGNGGTEITEEEYSNILSAIQTRPHPTETKDYRLLENLTWEEYEPQPGTEEPDAEEILSIILGGEE